jgi:hypothetical protein
MNETTHEVTPETLDKLQAAVLDTTNQLSDSDRQFATDLWTKARKYTPSPKQAFWIHEMILRASRGKQTPVETEVQVRVEKIVSIFHHAARHLKYPAIVLQTNEGRVVRLSVNGGKSKNPGDIAVASDGSWNSRTYYGRIDQQGVFHARTQATPDVIELVREFGDDPAGTASKYGLLTGRCCFCNTALTDERSTKVGYGPVCADHYGLSWGGAKTNNVIELAQAG